jgi:26S proteasome regulatory subunit N8
MITKASVHPLVLLFAVDHYNREAKDSAGKRVCGILLGKIVGGVVDVANCFAVPFEENYENGTWIFDSQYILTMRSMLKKVSGLDIFIIIILF